MKQKAFLLTPGDGRPTANAFWMGDHAVIIPKVEEKLRNEGLEPIWLHDKRETVCSHFMAAQIGRNLLAQMTIGDKLVVLTTGWNWPGHAGIIFTMVQDSIRVGGLQVINVCNMAEKAPGYVGQRANVLAPEIMQLPYNCLTIIEQTEAGWEKFGEGLHSVLLGTYAPKVPSRTIEILPRHEEIAREALKFLKSTGGVVPLVNVASMTMYQGWPNLYESMRMGITPIFVGSYEFSEEMAKIRQRDVNMAYGWLKEHGLKFEFRPGGLTRKEVDLALRMYLVKLKWIKDGAAGIGTQGQMEQIRVAATDLSESLIMSTLSPGKTTPEIDVTEADWEALLSSLIARAIIYVKTGKFVPVGFHDVRHFCISEGTLVLLNSGALAFDFMVDKPGDYSDITVVSQNRDVYFLKGGGAILGNMRASSGNSLFRLHAKGPTYTMKATTMNLRGLSWQKRNDVYGNLDRWPMGIAQMPGGAAVTEAVTLDWIPNHAQHTTENILPELAAVCKILGYGFHCYA